VALALAIIHEYTFPLPRYSEIGDVPNDWYVFQYLSCDHLIPEMCWEDGVIVILHDHPVIFEIISAFSDITHSLYTSTYINRLYTG
jgi:hypothetical protein